MIKVTCRKLLEVKLITSTHWQERKENKHHHWIHLSLTYIWRWPDRELKLGRVVLIPLDRDRDVDRIRSSRELELQIVILPPITVIVGGALHCSRAQQEHEVPWLWEHQVQVASRWLWRPGSHAEVRIGRRARARGGTWQAAGLQCICLMSQTAHVARILMFNEAFHPVN